MLRSRAILFSPNRVIRNVLHVRVIIRAASTLQHDRRTRYRQFNARPQPFNLSGEDNKFTPLPYLPYQFRYPLSTVASKDETQSSAVQKQNFLEKSKTWIRNFPKLARETVHHYWVGSKLLYYNIKMTGQLVWRIFQGHALTRRERRLLLRTTADLFKLIPFSIFVIVPFLEFTLPIFLAIFPNMLPSTFQDEHKEVEKRKKQLTLKIEMAKFLQDAVEEMASVKMRIGSKEAEHFAEFLQKVRSGEKLDSSEIVKFSKLFADDFTLDNLTRPHLVAMCKFLQLTPYGTTSFLRWQLRNKLKELKEDDELIEREGLQSLNTEELIAACQARGMRAIGLSSMQMRRQLADWLDLSLRQKLPAALLVLSRAFMITSAPIPSEEALKETLSALPEEVFEEVELKVEEGMGKKSAATELKLEILRTQSELIAEERKELEQTKKEISMATPAAAQKHADPTSLKEVADAVSLMTAESLLEKEKAALAELKAEQLTTKKMLEGTEPAEKAPSTPPPPAMPSEQGAEGPTGVVAERAAKKEGEEDTLKKRAQALQQRLDGLLNTLEAEVEKADQQIGSRLHLLDRDRDGVITTEELLAATKVLKKHYSNEQIKQLVGIVDTDHDGRIKVYEFEQIVAKMLGPPDRRE